jgi:hypothetical protein
MINQNFYSWADYTSTGSIENAWSEFYGCEYNMKNLKLT